MAMVTFDPINMKSVSQLTGNSKQVLVYGTISCGWEWIQSQLLTRKDSPVERVFNYVIGDDIPGHEEFIPPGAITTLEGRVIAKVSSGAKDVAEGPKDITIPMRTKRICKAALANWAFEVWRRKDEPSNIPLIFAIDIDENHYPLSAENLLSKTKTVRGRQVNEVTTFSEIRRLAKLCNDERIDPELRKEVERNTLFVRLKKEGKEFVLMPIPLPWKDPKWNEEAAKRDKQSVQVKKSYDWRKELNQLVAVERVQKALAAKSASAGQPNPPTEKAPILSPSTDYKEPPKKPQVSTETSKQTELRLLKAMFGSGFNGNWVA